MATKFENAVSQALAHYSRRTHRGYFANEGPLRDVYIIGYLVVRSVVARWEVTLGKRIKPIFAVKLLQNATQAGTLDVLPLDLYEPSEFRTAARSRFITWLKNLAALPKEAIERFLSTGAADLGECEDGTGAAMRVTRGST